MQKGKVAEALRTMSSPTEQELIELQETLYNSKNPTRRWLHEARRDWIVQRIQSAGTCARALEVGPGSGIYLPELAKVARQVVATDVEEAYLNRAEEKGASIAHLSWQRD